MNDTNPIHAGLLAYSAGGLWRGVLLRGLSGVGKSSLALALIGRGWRLVADDRVLAWPSGGRVWGRAPDVLRGLLEVRGVGVLSVPTLTLRFSQIHRIVDCVGPADEVERIPEPVFAQLCGVDLPACRIDASAPSAADKTLAFCDALRL